MGTKESEMTRDKERPAGGQSLFRDLMLIKILSSYPNGCLLAYLSELAGLSESAAHRLLQGLQSCGYVIPAPTTGSYRLTTKFIAVGWKTLLSLGIIHVTAPHLEALNIITGETVNFSSHEDDHTVLIYKLELTTGVLRTHAYIGQHMSLYCSAMGKIYMAFGHADYVKSYWESHRGLIQPLTRNTITGLPAMYDELAQVREDNMAMDREENGLDVSCIAMPVFDIHGRMLYAVSISLFTSRSKQIGEKNLLKPLRGTAQAISNGLGFTVRDQAHARRRSDTWHYLTVSPVRSKCRGRSLWRFVVFAQGEGAVNAFIMADAAKRIGCCTCEVVYIVAYQQNQDCALVSSSVFIPRIRVIKDDAFTTVVACHQCEDVLCANVCPTHAIRHERGHIFVEQARCIGYKSCMLACPFGVVSIVARSSQVQATKCDLCWHRKAGSACVKACPTSALQCIDTISVQRQRLRSRPL